MRRVAISLRLQPDFLPFLFFAAFYTSSYAHHFLVSLDLAHIANYTCVQVTKIELLVFVIGI